MTEDPYKPPTRPKGPSTGLASDRSLMLVVVLVFLLGLVTIAGIQAYRTIEAQTVPPRPQPNPVTVDPSNEGAAEE